MTLGFGQRAGDALAEALERLGPARVAGAVGEKDETGGHADDYTVGPRASLAEGLPADVSHI